jgi:transcriptional regulator with XRE-family HTH domain/plasmid maintenance system antidote protein VapI
MTTATDTTTYPAKPILARVNNVMRLHTIRPEMLLSHMNWSRESYSERWTDDAKISAGDAELLGKMFPVPLPREILIGSHSWSGVPTLESEFLPSFFTRGDVELGKRLQKRMSGLGYKDVDEMVRALHEQVPDMSLDSARKLLWGLEKIKNLAWMDGIMSLLKLPSTTAWKEADIFGDEWRKVGDFIRGRKPIVINGQIIAVVQPEEPVELVAPTQTEAEELLSAPANGHDSEATTDVPPPPEQKTNAHEPAANPETVFRLPNLGDRQVMAIIGRNLDGFFQSRQDQKPFFEQVKELSAALGESTTTLVHQIWNKKVEISPQALEQIAAHFGVTIEFFLTSHKRGEFRALLAGTKSQSPVANGDAGVPTPAPSESSGTAQQPADIAEAADTVLAQLTESAPAAAVLVVDLNDSTIRLRIAANLSNLLWERPEDQEKEIRDRAVQLADALGISVEIVYAIRGGHMSVSEKILGGLSEYFHRPREWWFEKHTREDVHAEEVERIAAQAENSADPAPAADATGTSGDSGENASKLTAENPAPFNAEEPNLAPTAPPAPEPVAREDVGPGEDAPTSIDLNDVIVLKIIGTNIEALMLSRPDLGTRNKQDYKLGAAINRSNGFIYTLRRYGGVVANGNKANVTEDHIRVIAEFYGATPEFLARKHVPDEFETLARSELARLEQVSASTTVPSEPSLEPAVTAQESSGDTTQDPPAPLQEVPSDSTTDINDRNVRRMIGSNISALLGAIWTYTRKSIGNQSKELAEVLGIPKLSVPGLRYGERHLTAELFATLCLHFGRESPWWFQEHSQEEILRELRSGSLHIDTAHVQAKEPAVDGATLTDALPPLPETAPEVASESLAETPAPRPPSEQQMTAVELFALQVKYPNVASAMIAAGQHLSDVPEEDQQRLLRVLNMFFKK